METVAELGNSAWRQVLELKPGGNHLMIIGLTSHPKEGERVKLTVRFAPGDHRLDVEFPVFRQEPK